MSQSCFHCLKKKSPNTLNSLSLCFSNLQMLIDCEDKLALLSSLSGLIVFSGWYPVCRLSFQRMILCEIRIRSLSFHWSSVSLGYSVVLFEYSRVQYEVQCKAFNAENSMIGPQIYLGASRQVPFHIACRMQLSRLQIVTYQVAQTRSYWLRPTVYYTVYRCYWYIPVMQVGWSGT